MKKEYIAPESKVMEMKAEGVLCNSFNGVSIQKWNNASVNAQGQETTIWD